MKLHLGCGQKYLDGYLNIDYSNESHSVQKESIADMYGNILELSYIKGSIEEIRLHHVFEHFTRPVACSLIASWHSWLKSGGVLHIEVPDLYRTGLVISNPFSSYRNKKKSIRHLFGSHEAFWAVHCEGYTSQSLKSLLNAFSFNTISIKKNKWEGTYNFEIIAQKGNKKLTFLNYSEIARNYLEKYLISNVESETKLLEVWMLFFNNQLRKSIGTEEFR